MHFFFYLCAQNCCVRMYGCIYVRVGKYYAKHEKRIITH